jgi:hypothetical protein
VPSWLIHLIITKVVDRLFVPDQYTRSDPEGWKSETVRILSSNFIHTHLLLPSGDTFIKHKGIPSGSAGTQLIGTIANLSVITYILRALDIPYSHLHALGDDSFFCTNRTPDYMNNVLYDMAELAESKFGMLLHPEKSNVAGPTDPCDFLGFTEHMGLEVVDQEKYDFKLHFSGEKMETLADEVLRFVALYAAGGYQLTSYQTIAQHLLHTGFVLNGEIMELKDAKFDKSLRQKFKYVFGVSEAQIRSHAPKLLQIPEWVLSVGATSYDEARLLLPLPQGMMDGFV